MDDCIFCKIVKGDIPSFKIWEDEKYMAFLDIRPIVPGMTLVIPKEHHGSYVMNVDLPVVCDLMGAVQKVAHILDSKLENVRQTNLIFEGVEVPHLHAKLLPMYNGAIAIEGVGERADNDELARIAEKLRS